MVFAVRCVLSVSCRLLCVVFWLLRVVSNVLFAICCVSFGVVRCLLFVVCRLLFAALMLSFF